MGRWDRVSKRYRDSLFLERGEIPVSDARIDSKGLF